jgi:hypothetical protein
MGAVEASIGPTETQIWPADQGALLVVFVRHSATDNAAIKAKIIGLMLEDGSIRPGTITFSTVAISGVKYISASATSNVSAKLQAKSTFVAVSRGKLTYYIGSGYLLKQKHTIQEHAALAAVLASFKIT